jgi:DNA-binding CsgD family transcriptional regulator
MWLEKRIIIQVKTTQRFEENRDRSNQKNNSKIQMTISLSILSKSEYRVCELRAYGATKKEIACQLFRSEDAIRTHLQNIHKKLGVHTWGELSALFIHSRFNIPLNLSPLARRIGAIIILLILIPCAFDKHKLFVRNRASITTIRYASVRARRMNETDYYSNLFKYEN